MGQNPFCLNLHSPRKIQLRFGHFYILNSPIHSSSPGNSTMMLLAVRPLSKPFFSLRSSTSTLRTAHHMEAQRFAAILLCLQKLREPLRFLLVRDRVFQMALVPGRGEKINVKSDVNSTSRMRLSVSQNSSYVSPGKPTIMSEVSDRSGISLSHSG